MTDEAARAVKARLVAEDSALVPGETGFIGLTFEIAPRWHLYWMNPGDSGLPIHFEFSVPKGVTVGEAQWPVPKRYVTGGIVLDYVYEDRVTLIFPITVDPALLTSGDIELSARLEWLVCREACVPGGTTASLSIPVRQLAESSPDAPLFAEARRRHPEPLTSDSRVSASMRSDTLHISAPGATSLTFFPLESGQAPLVEPIVEATASADRLSIRYDPRVREADSVTGVLEVRRKERAEFWMLSVPNSVE